MIRILKWTGLGLGVLLLALILWYLFIFDWNDIKDHFTTAVGDRTRREFFVGDLDVQPGFTSRVVLREVRLENARWSDDRHMVRIDTLEFTLKLLPLLRGRVVLPELTLVRPRIVLERNREGRPNWDFASDPAGEVATEAAVPEERGEFPIIGRLVIEDGELVYRDPTRNISLESEINTAVGINRPGQEQVRLRGKGNFQRRPFSVEFTGGALLALREGDEPYPFSLTARIGDTRIDADGSAEDPLQGEGVRMRLALAGQDMAEVFPIFGIPLPPTRPYQIAGQLTRRGKQWQFEDFTGKVGDSDLAGDIALDFTPDPPYMRAQLVSRQLQLSELAGFFGVRPEPRRKRERLIPDAPINLARLRAMNMDVDFRADHVMAAKVPTQRVEYQLRLRDGRLSFDPLRFDVAEGTISGDVHLDATREAPHLAANLRLQHLRLGRFLPKLGAAGVAYGVFGGQVRVEGSGRSFRRILTQGSGGFWLSMSGGAVNEVVLAAAGIDVPDLLRLLGADEAPVPLRCSVLAFDLKDGALISDVVVVDAETSTLFGEGTINLWNEAIDLRLDARAKEASPLTVGGSIDIEGKLAKPTVELDLSGAAGQAGAAAALAALLNPLAAILPFIDPGTGEDTECSELFSQAGRSVQKKSDAAATR